jgi:hypothetical protein
VWYLKGQLTLGWLKKCSLKKNHISAAVGAFSILFVSAIRRRTQVSRRIFFTLLGTFLNLLSAVFGFGEIVEISQEQTQLFDEKN